MRRPLTPETFKSPESQKAIARLQACVRYATKLQDKLGAQEKQKITGNLIDEAAGFAQAVCARVDTCVDT